jgi:muramidase (phage lysozyme)
MDRDMLIVLAAAVLAYVIVNKSGDTSSYLDDQTGSVIDQIPNFTDISNMTSDAMNPVSQSQSDANQSAFLQTIQTSEGTAKTGNPYATVYAYAFTITDFSDHPGNLGWGGVRLSDAMCAGAGLGSGCVSTAAGAYQITKTTWNILRKTISLPDFSPASQDAAAAELIRQKGALSDVQAGRFADAIGKVRRIWASLPGAGYGQGENSLATLQNAYTSAGGALA